MIKHNKYLQNQKESIWILGVKMNGKSSNERLFEDSNGCYKSLLIKV